MSPRVHNFAAGPAALPESVLAQAASEMLNYRDTGMSVMEMSHRSSEFIDIAQRAEADLRELLGVPEDYYVLFLQGGATSQFAAVPLNLAESGQVADYVHTGSWSAKAIKEAGKYCQVNVVATGESTSFCHVPPVTEWRLSDGAAYLHVCSNETIGGVQIANLDELPASGAPLVADMSSDILSRPVDVSRFGVIYAGAQKNIGPAGLTIVMVRKELAAKAQKITPSMLDYAVQGEADSMSNTPPTYAWYLAGLTFAWLKTQGGVKGIAEANSRKSGKLYSAIETSNFYRCPVEVSARSHMNVPFTLPDASMDSAFLSGAAERGLANLKGHRSVGGMRASIYNAVSEAAVDALVDYMGEFEDDHG